MQRDGGFNLHQPVPEIHQNQRAARQLGDCSSLLTCANGIVSLLAARLVSDLFAWMEKVEESKCATRCERRRSTSTRSPAARPSPPNDAIGIVRLQRLSSTVRRRVHARARASLVN